MPAHILHIDERLCVITQHAAVNRSRLEIEAGHFLNVIDETHNARGGDAWDRRQCDGVKTLHDVTEQCPHGAA